MKISYNPKSSQAAITPQTAANDDIIFDLYASKLWAKGIRIGADWADISSKPSSLKNPYALTISLNGTSQGPYDGSAAKNINITPGSIGAATSGHNHDGRYVYNYGGAAMDANSLNKNALGMSNNSGITGDWWHILQAGWNSEYRWNSQIAFPTQNKNGMYYRSGLDNNTAWGDWVKLLDVNNSYVTGGKGYINSTEITQVNNASKLQTARNLWGNSFDGTKDINGSIVFPAIGDTATSNKISWSGSSDGADIYYQTIAKDQGNLVLNVKDDTNAYIQLALNGVFKSHFDVANSYWTGKSALADKWTTARTFTIGNTAKNVDGSGNVSWSLAEIGVKDTWRAVQVNGTSIGNNTLNLCGSTYIGLANVNGKVTFSLVGSGTTANQAILSNGTANGWTLKTLNIANWDTAYNLRHSHDNKSVLDGITSALVNNWNTAYTFVNTITGTDTDKVINKWDEIVNFLAGITEDNKLNTLLNSKLSVYELADNTNVGTIKNNGIYYSTTDVSSSTLTNSPFNTGFALINMTSYDGGDDLRRSRLAFNANGEIKISDDRNQANTAETWYNVLTSKNSGINGSTIKLNGTSITVYSSSTADGRYVKKTGDTMTGALNFANNTWNQVGDDAAIGDHNVAGCLGIKGLTAGPGLAFYNSSNTLLSKLVGTANQFQRVSGNNIYNILDNSTTHINDNTITINGSSLTVSKSDHNHDGRYLKWLGNAGQSNMNAIGRISHSSGMTNLSDPGNTIDNPMEGGSKSTYWHLYWQTNYSDDPSGSNAWVAQIVNKAGTDRWWVRSRDGGTITNGTNWTSNWRFLVTAPTSGLGSANQPVYINSAGEVVLANNYPTSLKNPYSLNIFGVAYDGSAAKTVTTSTFISQLSEGPNTVTDGTMFITSWASDSGFADTNAVNVPYKRKASCLWNYIDSKVSSKYLPLAGGTMNGNARIGHGSGNLYIGNLGNDGWIYTQDIASQKGIDKWSIRESGATHFGALYIASKTDNSFNSNVIECNSTINLNYFSSQNVSLCNGGGTVQIGSYTTGDTGNNKLYVNGSEFINGASNVKDHVFANGFRHRSHNSDDSVLLAGGGYSQGVPVRYWAIYYMYIGNSSTDVTYTKRSGNYNFITSEAWESEGSARFDISFPSGYNKNNTLIFGNGDHRTSSSWKTPVYVTITTSTAFGGASQIRVMISDDANLNVGFANIYFMCMG